MYNQVVQTCFGAGSVNCVGTLICCAHHNDSRCILRVHIQCGQAKRPHQSGAGTESFRLGSFSGRGLGYQPLAETGNAPDTLPNLSAEVGTDGYATLTWTTPANNDKN